MLIHVAAALLAGLALLSATPGPARAAPGPGQSEVVVLTYNVQICFIFCGGHRQDIADVVTASGANVVGLQEDNNGAASVAGLLGPAWNAHDFGSGNGNLNSFDTSILTTFPITNSYTDGIEFQLPNGDHAYAWVVHLTPFPYQPYDIRDGSISTEAQAIAAAEAARGTMVDSVLQEIALQAPLDAPVFLIGDWNEPSHIDWSPAAAVAGHHMGWSVDWPASNKVLFDGFSDAFRDFSPDEVVDLGETWTPTPGANEVHDRIDIIYYAGVDVSLEDVAIVGESAMNADIVVSPWPSDHRGVVATFYVPEPGAPRLLAWGVAAIGVFGRLRTRGVAKRGGRTAPTAA